MEVEELAVACNNSGNNPNKDPNTVRDPDRIRTAVEENEPETVEPEGKHVDQTTEGQKSNNTHSEGHYGNLA